MKHLAIILSMDPDQGGKFQYSMSLLDAFQSFNPKIYTLSIIFFNENWNKYILSDHINKFHARTTIPSRIIRKIFLSLPLGLKLWRSIGQYFDPLHISLHSLKPDLIFYPGNDRYVYEIPLPGVISIHDLMHKYLKGFPEISNKKIYNSREYHYKNVCKYARGILVDSEMGKSHVLENYNVNENIIHVLPYVAPSYVRTKNPVPDVNGKYGLPEKYIFYPSMYYKHKNHEGLIKAIHLLKEKGLVINAVFVGPRKQHFNEVKNVVEQLNLSEQIKCLPHVSNDELVSLYKSAVGLVMPTFAGPTNIPPLEAFALGCPVVISNVYGMPAQVEDAALLFDPNNTEELAEKISIIWNDEFVRRKCIAGGFRRDSEWNQDKFNLRFRTITNAWI